jgi:Holliday junction DNA helicase RuvA
MNCRGIAGELPGSCRATPESEGEFGLIALITGQLAFKEPTQIIVDVGGIGYELTIPVSTYYELGEPGSEVTLRVHTHVREEALQLFGFLTAIEKRVFLLLTGVSGIGPKLAITILSGMGTEELIRSLHTGDHARLVGIPGIGRKTAERMVVELKDKVAGLAMSQAAAPSAPAQSDPTDDLISALTNLGYPSNVAEKAVAAALHEQPEGGFSRLLRLALRQLAK